IDDLIHGTMDNIQKVFLVSAGNVRQLDKISDYPDSNLIETIEDPGQSWNAITVGAYTNLDKPIDSTHNVIARRGEISPFSRTSELFNDIWPIKPEVVLEGGNAVKLDNVGYTDENLSILTSHHDPSERIFTITNGTSAATALASWMPAKIQSEYPE